MSIGFVQPTKTCIHCQARIRANTQFCTQCGHFIAHPNKLLCTQCGKQAEERSDRFCADCGASLTRSFPLRDVAVRHFTIPQRPVPPRRVS